MTLLDGGELDLRSLHGKPTLIVNTASKCGYTPQYEGLQKLYERYSERGLQMLGSPSGDFADQEFDGAEEIGEFCQKNYGVTFPLTERTSVRADPSALWADLARQPESGPPGWNFTKYLIDGRRQAGRPLGEQGHARGSTDRGGDRGRAARPSRRLTPAESPGSDGGALR